MIEPPEPVDHGVRERIARELETTFLVEAGAGTGKTSVLVDRYVACLRSDAAPPISSVVAITFTEKAAGELRQRIRGRLEELVAGERLDGAARARLAAALADLDDAPISTIHSFAARLLRERPVEAGVDPAFVQLDQVASDLLSDRLWRDWLAGLLDRGDSRAAGGPAAWLAEVLLAGVSLDDVARLARTRFAERFSVDDAGPPTLPALAPAIEAIKLAAAGVVAAAQACAADDDRLKRGGLGLAAEAAALPAAGERHELGRELVALAGRTSRYCPASAGKASNWPGGKDAMLGLRDALADAVSQAADAYKAYVAGLALAVAADYAHTAARAQLDAGALDFDDLLGRARELLAGAPDVDRRAVAAVRRYFQARYRYILVDEFQDTDPLQAEIAFFLAEREPTARTWRDVELEPGKLFLVGDAKQSIYRFRRADIAMYHEVADLIRQQGGAVVALEQNFRTVGSIVEWVNSVFDDVIGPAAMPGMQPAYQAIAARRDDPDGAPRVLVVRQAEPGEPSERREAGEGPSEGVTSCESPQSLEQPETPGPGATLDPAATPIPAAAPSRTPDDLCRDEARLIADLLAHTEGLGWRVLDRDAEPEAPGEAGWRPARPGDVTILLPTFTRVAFYEQALREAGLPYRVEGGRTYFGRREVLDTLAVLRAVDAAADPVAVYNALHSELFGFSDDELYAFHAAGGVFDYLTPQSRPDGTGTAEIDAALAHLRELHELRNRRPLAESLDDLLRRTRFLEGLALWADDPEQANGNVAKLVSLADEFGAGAEATFHAFVAKMRDDARAADTAESPVGESGEFVRLMTVHKAKGLEFPVVVLASAMITLPSGERGPLVDRTGRRLDCSLQSASADPSESRDKSRFQTAAYEARYQHEKAALECERRRLLYVAVTRAADLLVLPLVADKRRTGSLHTYLQPHLAPAARCDGDAAGDGDMQEQGAARPLVQVVEWGGAAAGAAPPPPPRPTTDPFAAREAWRAAREAALASASRPAPIFAPSALERLEPPDWLDAPAVAAASRAALPAVTTISGPTTAEPPESAGSPVAAEPLTLFGLDEAGAPIVPIDAAPRSRERAMSTPREHALALGSAVHLALERVPLDDDAALDKLVVAAAAEAGIPGDAPRVAELARACWRAAALRAAARTRHYRELPVSMTDADTGLVIEGAIDLVYRDDERGGWVIIDYKTDTHPDPAGVRERYGGQAGAYARAFEAASGEQVVAIDVLLAALPDAHGAATTVRLAHDEALAELVESRVSDALGAP